MVAELAVLGAIGTVAGLIAFVTTTVETLNKKYHDFRDAASRLDYCRIRIRVIQQELESWKNTWVDTYDNSYPDAVYEMFWGRDGFQTVKDMLRGIEEEKNKLLAYLYCKDPSSPELTDSQRRTWYRILQAKPGMGQARPTDGWIKQLTYALFQSSYMKECIDRLKDGVEMLDKFSRRQYWMLLSKKWDPNKPVDPKELNETIEFQTQFTSAVRWLWDLYDRNEESKKWWLVLGKLSPEETLCDLAEGSTFTLNFVAQWREKYQLRTIAVNLTQSTSRRPGNTARNIRLNSLISGLSIKQVLQNIVANPKTRKAREPILGIVAISLVKTMVLLYDAPWTRDLCTCGILLNKMCSGEDICTFRQNRNTCHDEKTSEQTFLRLAVALAELGMKSQIMHVRFDENQFVFDVAKRDINQVAERAWTRVHEEKLLSMVQTKTGSRKYKLALESCFTLAKLESRNDVIVRPELIRRSPEDIVKPVVDYWKVVIEERMYRQNDVKE